MPVEPAKLQSAKETVVKVLRGEITEKTHRALFEDDIVFFNVAIVEQNDPTWLLTQLQSAAYKKETKTTLLSNLSSLHAKAKAIIGV